MRWTGPTRSRSTSAPWPRWLASPRPTSSAASAPASARRHTATSNVAVSRGACSCCGSRSGGSPTSATPSAPRAWGRSAGRSGPSSARQRRSTDWGTSRSRRPTASKWLPRAPGWRRAWRRDRAVLEKHLPRRYPNLGFAITRQGEPVMITKLNVTSIYVLDKDEALDFYVKKLGLEKGNDVRQGTYRWLPVRVPGDVTETSPGVPGPPAHDEATAARL